MPSPSDSESTGSCLGAARPWGLGRETQAEQQAPVSSPCAERAKAKRREKGPETLLVKEGGCRRGGTPGQHQAETLPRATVPLPPGLPLSSAMHRPRTGHSRPSWRGGASPASPLSCHQQASAAAVLQSCLAASHTSRALFPVLAVSVSRRLLRSLRERGMRQPRSAVSADRTLQKGRADGGRMKGPEAGVRG